jgi:MFS transporter, FSR family, fosmidomycin resistance protein
MTLSRTARVNLLIGAGHFLSHFYVLCLPPLFLVWQDAFGVSFAELGLSVAVMAAATGILQTPVGFLVDRYGARPFLIGGTLLMALPMATMGLATAYWQILVLSLISGIGNSVFHPTDYAILAGSVDRERMGSSFAFHTFTGNLGFALAPFATTAGMLVFGWRGTLMAVGLLGVPVVAALLCFGHLLRDQRKPAKDDEPAPGGARLLLSPAILLFFGFFMASSMAGSALQAWLITVLHEVNGLAVESASSALTGYVAGAAAGTLVGGWMADRTKRHLPLIIGLTIVAAALMALVGVAPLTAGVTIAAMTLSGLLTGASRTPRDVMLKDAAPPGEVGKVFGFVSSALPLGQALTPAPFGLLIDWGRPDLVLILSAAILLLSLVFIRTARGAAKPGVAPAPAE